MCVDRWTQMADQTSFKACAKGLAQGSDGREIRNGLIATAFLQCGDHEELLAHASSAKRFYTSFEDWQAVNAATEAEANLDAVMED